MSRDLNSLPLIRTSAKLDPEGAAIDLEESKRKAMLTAAVVTLPFSVVAADDELVGTYKLVSEQRKIVDSGEIVSTDSLGYISYGKDGHARTHRQKAETAAGKHRGQAIRNR
jgi:hypothetical protein